MERFMSDNAEKMLRLIRIVAADLPGKEVQAESIYSGLAITTIQAKNCILELYERDIISMSDKKVEGRTKIKVV